MSNLFEISYLDNGNYPKLYVVSDTMSNAVKCFEDRMGFSPVSCTELDKYSGKIMVYKK